MEKNLLGTAMLKVRFIAKFYVFLLYTLRGYVMML